MPRLMNSTRRRTLFIVLALLAALLATLFTAAQPTMPAQAAACQASVNVRPGDTLGKIAEKFNVRPGDLNTANRLYAPYYTIYVGQKLCIPAGANAFSGAPAYANALAADFSARLNNGYLEIKTSNFPKNSSYYVKASSDRVKNEKVGQLNTGSGGTRILKLALPADLVKAGKLTVCLKNNMTDANVCRVTKK